LKGDDFHAVVPQKGKEPRSGYRSLYFENKERGMRGGGRITAGDPSETRDGISHRA
jgi:hypothetical protein